MRSGISLTLDGPADSITIVRSRGRRLAKLIRADGTIEAYNSARLFDLITAPIPGLDALESALRWLTARSDCCIVRGAIAGPSRARGVRRLLHQDLDTGDRATLRDVPRHWLALDIDGLPRPDGLEAGDLPRCARIAIAGLSEAFQHVRCIVQTTASHGVAPGVRLRLWYWLSRSTSGGELRRWLRAAPVDQAVFGAAQPIYTAAPIFADRGRDPLPERIATLLGMTETVRVPPASALMLPCRPATAVILENVRTGRYEFAALVSSTARVARAAAGTRHATLLAEARRGEAGRVRGTPPE